MKSNIDHYSKLISDKKKKEQKDDKQFYHEKEIPIYNKSFE
jgi:hypothetical protein